MSAVEIKINVTDDSIYPDSVPSYAHPGDGAVDLRSSVECTIESLSRTVVPCGISVALPEGYAGLVMPRSGLAAKHGVTVLNTPGLIDSGYRGEINAILFNTDASEAFVIHPGDRIAQFMIVAAPRISFEPSDALDVTDRGTGGFGSSGIS